MLTAIPFSFDAPGESTLHLLSHIYAQRSFELWKLPEIVDWVQSTIDDTLLSRISSVTPLIREQAIREYALGTPENFVRHVIVAENRSVMTFFSPNAVPQTMNAYDPVPPLTALSHYDENYFTASGVNIVPRRPRRRAGGRQEMPEEVGEEENAQIQEMIMEEIRRRQARAQQEVPGAFHDPDDVESLVEFDPNGIDDEIAQDEGDEGSEESSEDEEEDVPAATGGFMETVYNLLWRRDGPNPAEQ